MLCTLRTRNFIWRTSTTGLRRSFVSWLKQAKGSRRRLTKPRSLQPMIIDCHCHAGKGDGLTAPWDTAAPLEKYLRRAAQARIDQTVLLAAFHSDYAIANREVARIVASDPNRFFGFAFVNPV